MHERPDEEFSLLFECAREPLDAEPFMKALEAQLRAAQRGARLRRVVIVLLGAALAAAAALGAAPLLTRLCVVLGEHVQDVLPRLGSALASPAGWVISLLVAVLLLRRSGVLGR